MVTSFCARAHPRGHIIFRALTYLPTATVNDAAVVGGAADSSHWSGNEADDADVAVDDDDYGGGDDDDDAGRELNAPPLAHVEACLVLLA